MSVWWKCKVCNNSWNATIASRNRGCGCNVCAGNLPKRVQNVETGEIFESFGQAAKLYNGVSAGISACCRGKQKTAYGFHWKYVD